MRTIFWHNRWSGAVLHVSNRMKRSNLQKRDKTYSVLGCFGVCGRKNFFTLSPSYAPSPKNREKSLYPTVLELGWVILRWWDEKMTLFVFSACYKVRWNWWGERKQTKNAKIRRGSIFFAKSALIRESIFRTQPINAVHGRCSNSGVLRDIPSNFTISVRRRSVFDYSVWALSDGVDVLVAMSGSSEQMGWQTRTSALSIRDLRQIAYLLPMWGWISSGAVFGWRRVKCLQNSSLRMFWYGDSNSSRFFPRFGALECEANRTPDVSSTFIGSRENFCKHNRISVCPARKRKASIFSVSYR